MITIVVDRFSKHAHFLATMKYIGGSGSIDLLFRYIFAYHGFPKTITSDRDIRFDSFYYREITERIGIKLTKSSSKHPQTDGQTERTIQTLNRLLRTYSATNHQNRDRFLPQIELAYNSTPNRILHKSPFEIDLGFIPNPPLLENNLDISARNFAAADFAKHLKAITLRTHEFLENAQTEMETSNNQNRQPLLLNRGEYVLIHRNAYFKPGKYQKILPLYVGPFKVVKKINDNACGLDLPSSIKKHRVINVQHLKKYIPRPDQYVKQSPKICYLSTHSMYQRRLFVVVG